MHKTLLTQLTGCAFLILLIMLQPVSASQTTARNDSADAGVRLFVFNCGDYDVVAAGAAVPAYDPALFEEIRKRPTRVLDGDFDVFGDGTVRLISATGHTPGHQVLYLELAEFGPLILSGDLYHFRISREQRRVPIFSVDKGLTLTEMDKIEV